MIKHKHIVVSLVIAAAAALVLLFWKHGAQNESTGTAQTPGLPDTNTPVEYVSVAGLRVKFVDSIPLDLREKLKTTVLPVFGQFVETISKITNYHGTPIFPFPPGATLTIEQVMSADLELTCSVATDKCRFGFFAGGYGDISQKIIDYFEVCGRDEQGNPRNLDRLSDAPDTELIVPYSVKNMPPLIHDARFAKDVSRAIISALGVDPRNFVITRAEQISCGGYILPGYYIERTRIDKTVLSVSLSLQLGAPPITNYIIPAKYAGLAMPQFNIAIDLRTGTLMGYLDSARSALFGTPPLDKELKPMASTVEEKRAAASPPSVLIGK